MRIDFWRSSGGYDVREAERRNSGDEGGPGGSGGLGDRMRVKANSMLGGARVSQGSGGSGSGKGGRLKRVLCKLGNGIGGILNMVKEAFSWLKSGGKGGVVQNKGDDPVCSGEGEFLDADGPDGPTHPGKGKSRLLDDSQGSGSSGGPQGPRGPGEPSGPSPKPPRRYRMEINYRPQVNPRNTVDRNLDILQTRAMRSICDIPIQSDEERGVVRKDGGKGGGKDNNKKRVRFADEE